MKKSKSPEERFRAEFDRVMNLSPGEFEAEWAEIERSFPKLDYAQAVARQDVIERFKANLEQWAATIKKV
jgi:hypothetical protein